MHVSPADYDILHIILRVLRPGPWAADSVPSSGPGVITQAERDALNPIGDESGCH